MSLNSSLLVLSTILGQVIDPPSSERESVGRLQSRESILLKRDGDTWSRFAVNDAVRTNEPLVSLPGYKSEVKLDSKVTLLLRGEVPEIRQMPLLESAVTLHATKLDADLTLHRGRIYLTNQKERGPATVRLRFRDQLWDLTLDEPNSMAGFEVMTMILSDVKPREGREPVVHVTLYLLKGKATLKAGFRTFGDLAGPTGRSLVTWNNQANKLDGPHQVEKPIAVWQVDAALGLSTRPYEAALSDLAEEIGKSGAKIEATLLNNVKAATTAQRKLAIRSLGAIDSLPALVDLMATEGGDRMDVRTEAVFTIRHWLSRGKGQEVSLFDRKKRAGLLTEKGYKANDAEMLLDLIYPLAKDLQGQRETFALLVRLLRHEKLGLREVAHQHLLFLAPGQNIDYNAGGGPEQRERGYLSWKKLLDDGKLPPQP